MNNESGLDYDSSFGWMSHRVRHRSSASWEIFGGLISVSWLGVVLLAFAVMFSLSGCSTVQTAVEQSEVAEEAVEQGEDLFRAGEDIAKQAQETGQSAKRLTPQRSCVEAKNTEDRFQVKARLIGTDQRYTLRLNEYKRFDLSGGWFTDRHTFTIEMEVLDNKTGEFSTRAQTVENNFDRYQLTKQGCGVLYFTADEDRIRGFSKPGEMDLN